MKYLKEDMTYNEIEFCKTEIKKFILEIGDLEEYNFNIKPYDEAFFIVISKHILFFKYLYMCDTNIFYFRVLISDLYYFIESILKSEIRYMYLNERSVIENYTRLITNISIKNDHITDNSFRILKQISDEFNFENSEFSLVKSEYAIACGYVHGSDIIKNDLSYVFDECILKKKGINERTKYYDRIKRVFKYFDSLLICVFPDYISGCFHRKKALLGYLIGQKCVDLLFEQLNKK